VELDIEYRALAEKSGVNVYRRVPALGTHPAFIEALAELVQNASGKRGRLSQTGERLCPAEFGECACEGATDG
jgi:ferrochelatase